MATPDAEAGWHDGENRVSRSRGRLFEAVCLAATSVGLVAVFVLLLYVTKDALRPFSADWGWHLTYLLTLVLPAAALGAYCYRVDEPAGEVAYTTTGLPIVGLFVAGGLFILFLEIVTVAEWFALALSLALALAVAAGHAYARPTAGFERLLLWASLSVYAVFGLPPDALVGVVDVPTRIVSLRELILAAPVLPTEWLQLLLTLTLPAAAIAGLYVARCRGSRREGAAFGGLLFAGAALAFVAGPALGIGADGWVIVYTPTVVPLATYVEGVARRREGRAGLLFPVALVAGTAAGTLAVGALGFAGPEPWLDWGFLTSPTSRFSPEDAGIYPPLVGSVMMMIVIVLSTFPVGVGAAIYLEEYAPSSGLLGRIVTLIEINIGNLAGVPSIVYGLLGLALFIRFFQLPNGSVAVGGFAVGLLVLPIVIINSQEAIRAVPDSMREASYGMGATRWQTTRNVVLPEAIPGILTGTILALGRAIGETAPLLMIGMASSVRLAPNGFFDRASAMPRQIFSWAFEIEEAFRHGVMAAGVVTLLVILLLMNGAAIVIRNKYQR